MAVAMAMTVMLAVVVPVSARMRVLAAVTMPGMGMVARARMMLPAMMPMEMVHKRSGVVMVEMMMRWCHAYGDVDAGSGNRRHGESGGGKRQCCEEMFRRFHVGPFMSVDYTHSTDRAGKGQQLVCMALYQLPAYSTPVLLHSRRVASSSMASIASLKCMDLSKKWRTPSSSAWRL